MDELYDRWTRDELEDATAEEVIQNDQQFFEELGDPEGLKMIGLDQAENAVAFAEEIGLVDVGLPLNLEQETLPADVRQDIETGGSDDIDRMRRLCDREKLQEIDVAPYRKGNQPGLRTLC